MKRMLLTTCLILAADTIIGFARDEPAALPKPSAPFVAWFEPPALDSQPELYHKANLITSLVERHAAVLPKLAAQGTSGLRWAFGPTSAAAEHSRQAAEFYAKQFSPLLLKDGTMAAGIGIDECGKLGGN